MADKHEMKELREAVEAIANLGGFIARRASDGVGIDDGFALAKKLFLDDEFQGKLVKAVQGIQNISEEIKEELTIDGTSGMIAEGFELGSIAVKEFVKEFKM